MTAEEIRKIVGDELLATMKAAELEIQIKQAEYKRLADIVSKALSEKIEVK